MLDLVLRNARLLGRDGSTFDIGVAGGRIAEIAIEGERARVRLAGAPPVVAEVTLGSIARLGLREGAMAWASFKAVEIHLMVERGPTDTL